MRMCRTAALAPLLLQVFAVNATDSAALMAEGWCRQSDSEFSASTLQSLEYIGQSLPNVPPEEANYYEAESDGIDKSYGNEQLHKSSHDATDRRYAALSSRRLYYVWKVRKKLSEVMIGIQSIVNPEVGQRAFMDGKYSHAILSTFQKEDANRLERTIEMVSPLSDLKEQIRELVVREQYQRVPLFTNEQFAQLSGILILATGDLGRFMGCKLAKTAAGRQFPD